MNRDFIIRQTFIIDHHIEAPSAAEAKRIADASHIEIIAHFNHVATIDRGRPQFYSVPCLKCKRTVHLVKSCVYCRLDNIRADNAARDAAENEEVSE